MRETTNFPKMAMRARHLRPYLPDRWDGEIVIKGVCEKLDEFEARLFELEKSDTPDREWVRHEVFPVFPEWGLTDIAFAGLERLCEIACGPEEIPDLDKAFYAQRDMTPRQGEEQKFIIVDIYREQTEGDKK